MLLDAGQQDPTVYSCMIAHRRVHIRQQYYMYIVLGTTCDRYALLSPVLLVKLNVSASCSHVHVIDIINFFYQHCRRLLSAYAPCSLAVYHMICMIRVYMTPRVGIVCERYALLHQYWYDTAECKRIMFACAPQVIDIIHCFYQYCR